MQGGMIIAAMDNALGSLSMLVAPLNMTRSIDSKLKKAITIDLEFIYITATLKERKKRRLVFDVDVKDKDGECYATAQITNWIIDEK
jgi:acyl-coenzyme A thioesterase PaaI-like protein